MICAAASFAFKQVMQDIGNITEKTSPADSSAVFAGFLKSVCSDLFMAIRVGDGVCIVLQRIFFRGVCKI